MKKFEANKNYQMTSVGDSNVRWSVHITKRTAKTSTTIIDGNVWTNKSSPNTRWRDCFSTRQIFHDSNSKGIKVGAKAPSY